MKKIIGIFVSFALVPLFFLVKGKKALKKNALMPLKG